MGSCVLSYSTPAQVQVFHAIQRCVRRAFLCSEDGALRLVNSKYKETQMAGLRFLVELDPDHVAGAVYLSIRSEYVSTAGLNSNTTDAVATHSNKEHTR